MSFIFLKNLGGPTRWDGTSYFSYREKNLINIPESLRSMTAEARYLPGGEGSFWNSRMTGIYFDSMGLSIEFTSDSGDARFVFLYHGVRKVISDYKIIRGEPSMAVQELSILRRIEIYRHAIVSPFGKFLVIYASAMGFEQRNLSEGGRLH